RSSSHFFSADPLFSPVFFSVLRHAHSSTLFPYTTLFRSSVIGYRDIVCSFQFLYHLVAYPQAGGAKPNPCIIPRVERTFFNKKYVCLAVPISIRLSKKHLINRVYGQSHGAESFYYSGQLEWLGRYR